MGRGKQTGRFRVQGGEGGRLPTTATTDSLAMKAASLSVSDLVTLGGDPEVLGVLPFSGRAAAGQGGVSEYCAGETGQAAAGQVLVRVPFEVVVVVRVLRAVKETRAPPPLAAEAM